MRPARQKKESTREVAARPRIGFHAPIAGGLQNALLQARSLPANRKFIFHYPFAGTPCFLLNLGKPTKPSASLKTADKQSYEADP